MIGKEEHSKISLYGVNKRFIDFFFLMGLEIQGIHKMDEFIGYVCVCVCCLQ